MSNIPPTPDEIAKALVAAQEQKGQQSYEYDVFLSYATPDKERAKQIGSALQAKGLNCFMACKNVSGGDDFSDKIRLALLNSREMCLLFSPNSLKSEWVLTEWGAAWALGKRIVPILHRLDVGLLPERLKIFQAIDLTDIEKYVSEVLYRCSKTKKKQEVQVTSQLEGKADSQEKLVYEAPFYWLGKGVERDGPFCQKCYDADGKLIRLQKRLNNDEWDCFQCDSYFTGPGYVPPNDYQEPYDPLSF